jgi:hypothetical protein
LFKDFVKKKKEGKEKTNEIKYKLPITKWR